VEGLAGIISPYLRAIEWRDWPLFIGQPIIPVLLYLQPTWWWGVPTGVILFTIIWRLDTVPKYIDPVWVGVGPLFVRLRFISAPISAFLIWRAGHLLLAAEALLWPFLGSALAQLVLIIPMGLISMMPYQKAAELGVVQARLLRAVGFTEEPEEA